MAATSLYSIVEFTPKLPLMNELFNGRKYLTALNDLILSSIYEKGRFLFGLILSITNWNEFKTYNFASLELVFPLDSKNYKSLLKFR